MAAKKKNLKDKCENVVNVGSVKMKYTCTQPVPIFSGDDTGWMDGHVILFCFAECGFVYYNLKFFNQKILLILIQKKYAKIKAQY